MRSSLKARRSSPSQCVHGKALQPFLSALRARRSSRSLRAQRDSIPSLRAQALLVLVSGRMPFSCAQALRARLLLLLALLFALQPFLFALTPFSPPSSSHSSPFSLRSTMRSSPFSLRSSPSLRAHALLLALQPFSLCVQQGAPALSLRAKALLAALRLALQPFLSAFNKPVLSAPGCPYSPLFARSRSKVSPAVFTVHCACAAGSTAAAAAASSRAAASRSAPDPVAIPIEKAVTRRYREEGE